LLVKREFQCLLCLLLGFFGIDPPDYGNLAHT